MTTPTRFALATLLVSSFSSARPTADAGPFAEVAARFARERNFSGVVLVVRNGRTVYEGAFGRADVSRGTLNTPDTRFRVASVCKLLMAVLTLKLQEEGRLKLDAPISSYLPGELGAAGKVTVRQLLNHTSGLPDPERSSRRPIDVYQRSEPLGQHVRRFVGPLRTAPGTTFAYNNFDYVVLSRVVEAVTAQPWAQALRDRVLVPAGMRDSGVFADASVPSRLARAQYRDAGVWKDDPAFLVRQYFGAAALYATAADLARFDAALRAGRLITTSSRAVLNDGDARLGYVALGHWVFPQTLGGRTVTLSERYGNLWGSYSVLARGVSEANVVIVLSNRHDPDANVEQALKNELLGVLYR